MTQAQGPFAQLPYSLWTFPGLCPLERWLCATIIRLCWRPGPQAFSYRTLAKESGISVGSFSTTQHHEGMIPKLERLGLVKTYKPTDEEGHVLKGRSFLIEPTQHLWQLNQQGSVQPVNTSKVEEIGEGVYQVNTTAYSLNTSVQVVNTTAYSLNTEEGINLSQKHDESTPNIKIDTIDSNIHSLVVSADAESDGGPSAFLEKISSFEETLEEIQQQEEDRVIIDHLPNGQQVIRRTSGRPLGELIPVGADIQEAIRDLISAEGTRGEIQATVDGKALLDPPSYQREEKEPEGLPRVVALLDATTPEPTEKDTVSLSTDGRMMRTPTQMSTQPPTEEEPTQNTLIPAPPIPSLSTKGAAKTPSPDKTDGVEKNKKRATMKDCSPEEQSRRRTWQVYFNTRRGGELLHGKGERIDESNCIADLCRDFSDGQISLIDRFVLAEIFPYKLPINRHKAGAHVIWKESQNAREVLKDRQKWPGRDAPPGQALPQATPSQQEDVYTRKIRELAAESAARYTTPHMQGVAL